MSSQVLTEESSKPSEACLDRLAKKIEQNFEYFLNHREELYSPFLKISALCFLISLISFGFTLASQMKALALNGEPTPPDFWYFISKTSAASAIWYITAPFYDVLMIFVSFAVRNRMRNKSHTAHTLFATYLVSCFCGFHLLLLVLGIYVGFNSKFREATAAWAPGW